MQSRTKQEAWVKAALADGWEKSSDPQDSGVIKQSKSTYFTLLKEGFRVRVYFHKKASMCSLHIFSPNGNRHETYDSGQLAGYNWVAMQELINACPHCSKKDQDLRQYSYFTFFCQDCIDKIKQFVQDNPPPKPREYIGTAEIEFRSVRGKKNTGKVQNYRILAKIEGPSYSAWEPYNGTNKNEAIVTYRAVQVTLSVAGYKVSTKEVTTTWNGEEI